MQISIYLAPGLTVYCCLLALVLGLCMGSFLNCMAWRIVRGESVLKGRSHCDVCGHVLTRADLVPVVSFLWHKGRCRWCGAKLSKEHLLAEIWTGLTYVLLLLKYDISLQGLEWAIFASLLLACSFADLEGYMIPDRFILAGIAVRLAFFFVLHESWAEALDSLLGGFAVGGGLLALVLLYEKARKVDAMGGGDLKLLFVTGLYLGWKRNLLALLFACVFGIVFALATRGRRQNQEDEKIFPWGPSICAAAIFAALIGNEVIAAYLGLF